MASFPGDADMTTSHPSDKPQYHGRDLEAMSFAPRYQQWILDSISPYLGTKVLEVGAGSGNFTRLLLNKPGLELTAIEPSANMYPMLAEVQTINTGLCTANAPLAALASEMQGKFDSVLYINVLEHIENDALELSLACQVLKPGGKLIVFVPALAFLFSHFDTLIGHYRRYHRPALADLTVAAGFAIDRLHYFDIAGILPWYINFTLMKNAGIPGSVAVYDSMVVPVMRRLEAVVRPPVGKNLLLIAHQQEPGAGGLENPESL